MGPLTIGYRFLRPWFKCKPCHTILSILARKLLKRSKDDDIYAMVVPQWSKINNLIWKFSHFWLVVKRSFQSKFWYKTWQPSIKSRKIGQNQTSTPLWFWNVLLAGAIISIQKPTIFLRISAHFDTLTLLFIWPCFRG